MEKKLFADLDGRLTEAYNELALFLPECPTLLIYRHLQTALRKIGDELDYGYYARELMVLAKQAYYPVDPPTGDRRVVEIIRVSMNGKAVAWRNVTIDGLTQVVLEQIPQDTGARLTIELQLDHEAMAARDSMHGDLMVIVADYALYELLNISTMPWFSPKQSQHYFMKYAQGKDTLLRRMRQAEQRQQVITTMRPTYSWI